MLPQLDMLTPRDFATAAIDIIIVAFLVYRMLLLIRGTRAVQLLKGIIILLVVSLASRWLNLVTIAWLLDRALVVLLVALPVVFQPELRRGLEQLGRGGLWRRLTRKEGAAPTAAARDIASACQSLARSGRGALILVQRETGLAEIVETGVAIDGRVSAELLVSLFLFDGPLHDGAVVIQGERVVAAGCYLPLSDSVSPGSSLGGRHRAALGVSEQTDAMAVVLSEETGEVSLAEGGRLTVGLSGSELVSALASPAKRPADWGAVQ